MQHLSTQKSRKQKLKTGLNAVTKQVEKLKCAVGQGEVSLRLANNLLYSIQDSKLAFSSTQGMGDEYMKGFGLVPVLLKCTIPVPRLSRIVVMTPWLRFKLSPTNYERWEQKYQEDGFVQDKLRYDYFPSASLFVPQTPIPVHELLASSVVGETLLQLRVIASRADPTGEFARKILNPASPTIRFDPKLSKHAPDGSFRHNEAKYPGVVIEVSYSEKRQNLPCLADSYILGSRAEIGIVVGIDLDYRGKRATVSLWRPRIIVDAAGRNAWSRSKRQISEDDPQAGLRLRLDDFTLKAYADEEASWDDEIFIPANDLFTYLEPPTVNTSKYKVIDPEIEVQPHESTPPEELREDDEK